MGSSLNVMGSWEETLIYLLDFPKVKFVNYIKATMEKLRKVVAYDCNL